LKATQLRNNTIIDKTHTNSLPNIQYDLAFVPLPLIVEKYAKTSFHSHADKTEKEHKQKLQQANLKKQKK
jgi:hypothetical protein